jgi:hypothetical protein
MTDTIKGNYTKNVLVQLASISDVEHFGLLFQGSVRELRFQNFFFVIFGNSKFSQFQTIEFLSKLLIAS